MFRNLMIILLAFFYSDFLGAQQKQEPQNPSPMVEHTRAHVRIEPQHFPGSTFTSKDILEKPILFYWPEKAVAEDSLDLLIYFHGSAFVPQYAVNISQRMLALAVINLGAGSLRYENSFKKKDRFHKIVAAFHDSLNSGYSNSQRHIRDIYLVGFSAGYGAIRALLKNRNVLDRINGVLLLDGLHTDYLPENTPLSNGGKLNTEKLKPFMNFASLAVTGTKTFIITHSEIFPGTFASTTETADYLLTRLGLQRKAILRWGPLGMQQLSEMKQGRFTILGFAGNSAPDHIDHLHGMFEFIKLLWESPLRVIE